MKYCFEKQHESSTNFSYLQFYLTKTYRISRFYQVFSLFGRNFTVNYINRTDGVDKSEASIFICLTFYASITFLQRLARWRALRIDIIKIAEICQKVNK